jgi:hypothetical protein
MVVSIADDLLLFGMTSFWKLSTGEVTVSLGTIETARAG